MPLQLLQCSGRNWILPHWHTVLLVIPGTAKLTSRSCKCCEAVIAQGRCRVWLPCARRWTRRPCCRHCESGRGGASSAVDPDTGGRVHTAVERRKLTEDGAPQCAKPRAGQHADRKHPPFCQCQTSLHENMYIAQSTDARLWAPYNAGLCMFVCTGSTWHRVALMQGRRGMIAVNDCRSPWHRA